MNSAELLVTSVRRRTYMTWFVSGLVVGGIISAIMAVVLGSLVRWPLNGYGRGLLTAFSVGALASRELGIWRFRLPENRRQVPRNVFRRGPSGLWQFGLELGTGVRTFLPTGLPYMVGCVLALFGDLRYALFTGTMFGLGRGAMLLGMRSRDTESGTWVEDQARAEAGLRVIYLVACLLGVCVAVLPAVVT